MKCPRAVLIANDERKIVEVLQAYLKKEGYQVLCAYDDTTAMKLFRESEVSLILLGLMLPNVVGEQVCRPIRTVSRISIIVLTIGTEEADLISGLQMGADDYIFKPFSPRAVAVKTGAVLRRAKGGELTSLSVFHNQGKLVTNLDNMTVEVQGKKAGLTPTGLKILTTMAKASNRISTREQSVTYALNDDFDGYDWSINTYIKRIWSKIEDDHGYPSYTFTVHGLGHKFVGEVE